LKQHQAKEPYYSHPYASLVQKININNIIHFMQNKSMLVYFTVLLASAHGFPLIYIFCTTFFKTEVHGPHSDILYKQNILGVISLLASFKLHNRPIASLASIELYSQKIRMPPINSSHPIVIHPVTPSLTLPTAMYAITHSSSTTSLLEN